jgi:hypothetical protein
MTETVMNARVRGLMELRGILSVGMAGALPKRIRVRHPRQRQRGRFADGQA